MSDSNYSEQPGGAPVSPESLLRFSCGNCGMELTAPLSAAGVEGPCPVCGVRTTAPRAGEGAGPQPIAPQPRPMRRPEGAGAGPPGAEGALPASHPVPGNSSPVPAPPAVPVWEPAPMQEQAPAYRSAPTQPAGPAGPLPASRPAEGSGRRRVQRSIDPSMVMSADYENSKEVKTLLRIFFAVLCTAAITWGVFYFMNKRLQEPPPEREVEFPVSR